MGECLECGRYIPRRKEKGHREREYCSDACRQRASRKRNKYKLMTARILRQQEIANQVDQMIHRETWQDDLEKQRSLIKVLMLDLHLREKEIQNLTLDLKYKESENATLQMEIDLLNSKLADKEAEIARLTVLLESQAKRRSPPH